jgi:transketolase/fructose-1,6-bisphosphatase class II
MKALDQRAITTVRMLAIDQVEAAQSGHPGIALGLAPIAYTLFSRIMNFDPLDPTWPNRDRFVLSPGHGSALLYALLHLFGYDLPVSELRRFRQLGSKTPGHPEYGVTPGVETTTGPLGQGLATAVGMAIAEAKQRAMSDGVIDHYTFVLVSDGDLMEGISHEAASLAGHLRLGRLIVGYDSNDITIDGPRHQSCTDDVVMRFVSYGWQVLTIADTEDVEEIERVYREAMADERPTLIVAPTIIGRGAPTKENTAKAHGAPLGASELGATKAGYGWPDEPTFLVPDEVRTYVDQQIAAKRAIHESWEEANPTGGVTASTTVDASDITVTTEPVATRVASATYLARVAAHDPALIGGSADLAESTGLNVGLVAITPDDFLGSVIHFGIREHAMAAIANGLALSGYCPYVSTFLVFSDYLRPALRLSALMGLGVIYLFSHDSFAVGEDGPTHQPIEQLEALRIIPNTQVLRPADAFETYACWELARSERSRPTILVLTRQPLPQLPSSESPTWLVDTGARVVHDTENNPEVVLVASGSEVALAIAAARILKDEDDVDARVISVPHRERFLGIDPRERDLLAPTGIPRLVVEASVGTGWHEFLSPGDRLYGINRFGASAPIDDVAAYLGFTPDKIAEAALDLVVEAYRLGQPSHLVADLLRATEAAACATLDEVGLGDKNRADQAAVSAMREELGRLPVLATVIVGEGEKDHAPMLFVGERLGTGTIDIDLAIDPLEGTNFAASGREGAISVIAAAPSGGLRALPGYYLEKLIVGERAAGVIDLDRPLLENVKRVASRLGLGVGETTVVILAKPRHATQIADLRAHGVPVLEISDGDVMASLRVLSGDPNTAMLWGIGGTPEGVISAAATLALSGQMQARCAPQSDEEAALVADAYPDYATRRFEASELAHPSSIVVATSVSGAYPLAPPRSVGEFTYLESLWIGEGRYGIIRRLVP